jgi:hypothetical protein
VVVEELAHFTPLQVGEVILPLLLGFGECLA